MVIAVTTPTGAVGRHVVRGLVRAGARPRVLLRHPERLDPDLRGLVDVAQADLTDVDQVVAATVGVGSLYWVDPPTDLDDPMEGYRRATVSAVGAVRANGVRRVVLQSSVGAERRGGLGEIDGLAHTEQALDGEDTFVTHLRCGYFFSNLLMDVESLREGYLATPFDLDQPLAWVAPADVATVAVARLLNEGWFGRHVQAVLGPRDLTFREVSVILGDVLGREVEARHLTQHELRRMLAEGGLTAAQVDAVAGMSAGLRDFEPETPREACSTTPTTLGAWAWDELRPAVLGHAVGARG